MQSAAAAESAEPIFVGQRVELQLLTTLKCNLKCSYCSLGVGNVLRSQKNATYSAAQLRAFVDKHLAGREVYITLYGGEPALNTGFALELLRAFPECRFNIQTNGTLLERLPDALLARLSNFMVSVDGGERITDAYRGRGVYRKVLDNVCRIRSRTAATLTARCTSTAGSSSRCTSRATPRRRARRGSKRREIDNPRSRPGSESRVWATHPRAARAAGFVRTRRRSGSSRICRGGTAGRNCDRNTS
jgi:hypothetical protein